MQNYQQFFNDLKKLVSYNSVQGEATKNAPLGETVRSALECFLEIARVMGFETINYDNYAGEIVYGKGKEIGIIGHVDIVPAGTGWTTDPFTLTEKNGFLFGRGVCDDKGPMLATLYALKELKESNTSCNVKFRLFVGTNEETGWQDVKYLSTKTTMPEFGFSPDGNFPVSYSEKGVYVLSFQLPQQKNFFELMGGTVVNAVCAEASVRSKKTIDMTLAKKYGLKVNGDKITSYGRAAHGSAPENGENAFKNLFAFMSECGEKLGEYVSYLFNDTLKIMMLNTEQGNVTFSPDLITNEGGKTCLLCDCRVPAPLSFEKDVKPLFDKMGLKYTYTEKHPPFMVDKNCTFVKTLVDAYNEATGERAEAVKMSGSTFARAFKQGCSFGFEFPTENNHMHEPDERISVESLNKGYNIIKTALFNLAKTKNL